MPGFSETNADLQTSGYMWFRQQYEEWLHAEYCTCKEHHTPFLKPPPYTCETFGVNWEDVAFQEEDSDEEDALESKDAPESKPKPESEKPVGGALHMRGSDNAT